MVETDQGEHQEHGVSGDHLGEHAYEIGMDEAWKANMKGQFDSFHDAAMARISRSQDHYDALLRQNLTNMANIQSGVLRHADQMAAASIPSVAAIAAAISQAVQDHNSTHHSGS